MKCAIVCAIVFQLMFVLKDNHKASAEIISENTQESYQKLPTVLIVTLFRNKEHTLPYFLSYLEQLDYPKDRITLW